LLAVILTKKYLPYPALKIHGKLVVQVTQTLNLVKRDKIKAKKRATWDGRYEFLNHSNFKSNMQI
jgi:IS30 family transposase